MSTLTLREPCRRPSSGTFRAYFNTQVEAEKFAADPANTDYHGDIAHLCGKCFRWHLSRPEWLVPDHQRQMTAVN